MKQNYTFFQTKLNFFKYPEPEICVYVNIAALHKVYSSTETGKNVTEKLIGLQSAKKTAQFNYIKLKAHTCSNTPL